MEESLLGQVGDHPLTLSQDSASPSLVAYLGGTGVPPVVDFCNAKTKHITGWIYGTCCSSVCFL